MKIVIATPLYPPDIAEPAPYVKELVKRLVSAHDVTIVAYGNLPEKVDDVAVVPISKRQPLLTRLFLYTIALMRAVRTADILIAENGASVELPAGIISLFSHKPLILHIGDRAAADRARTSSMLSLIMRFTEGRARAVVTDVPLVRPEILPFEPRPDAKLAAYEASWKEHIVILENALRHE